MVLRICWTNRTRVKIITFEKWLLPMKFYLSKLLNKMLTEFMFASNAKLSKNRRHSKIDIFDDNTLYFMYSNLLLVKKKKEKREREKNKVMFVFANKRISSLQNRAQMFSLFVYLPQSSHCVRKKRTNTIEWKEK